MNLLQQLNKLVLRSYVAWVTFACNEERHSQHHGEERNRVSKERCFLIRHDDEQLSEKDDGEEEDEEDLCFVILPQRF